MPKTKHRAEPKKHAHSHTMEKVKIKRVKRAKKAISTKEKILAGLGVGSTLIGGAGAVSAKPNTTEFVRTTDQTENQKGVGSKVKDALKSLFGVQTAKASEFKDNQMTDQGVEVDVPPDLYPYDPISPTDYQLNSLVQNDASAGGSMDASTALKILQTGVNPTTGQLLDGSNPSDKAILLQASQIYYGTDGSGGIYGQASNVSSVPSGTSYLDVLSGKGTQNEVNTAKLVDQLQKYFLNNGPLPSGLTASQAQTLWFQGGIMSQDQFQNLVQGSQGFPQWGLNDTNAYGNYVSFWNQARSLIFTGNADGSSGYADSASVSSQNYTNTVRTWTITDGVGQPAKDGAAMPGFSFNIQLRDIDPSYTSPTVKLVLQDGTEVDPTDARFTNTSLTFKMPNLPAIKSAKGEIGVRVKITQGNKTTFLKYAAGDFNFYGWGELNPSMISAVRSASGQSQLAGLSDRDLAKAVLDAIGENGNYNVSFLNSDGKFGSTQSLAQIRDGVPQAVTLSDVLGQSFYQSMLNDGTVSQPQIANDSILSEFTINSGAIQYHADLAAQGFSGTVRWSATGLPAGLSIDQSTGVISGMPTTAGRYNITVTATSGSQTATKTYTINVYAPNVVATNPPIISSISNNDVPQGQYIDIKISGSKLTGASLSFPANSGLSVAVTGFETNAGLDTISARVTASPNATPTPPDSKGIPLTISGTAFGNMVVTPGALNFRIVSATEASINAPDLLPNAPVGQAYSFTDIKASNILSPRWSLSGQPSWLTINPSTGALSGTPVERGDFGFYVIATYTKADGSVATVNKFLTLHATQDYWSYTAGIPNVNTTPASTGGQTVTATSPTITQALYNQSGNISILGTNFNTTEINGNTIQIFSGTNKVFETRVSSGSSTSLVVFASGLTPGNYTVVVTAGGVSSQPASLIIASPLSTRSAGGASVSGTTAGQVTLQPGFLNLQVSAPIATGTNGTNGSPSVVTGAQLTTSPVITTGSQAQTNPLYTSSQQQAQTVASGGKTQASVTQVADDESGGEVSESLQAQTLPANPAAVIGGTVNPANDNEVEVLNEGGMDSSSIQTGLSEAEVEVLNEGGTDSLGSLSSGSTAGSYTGGGTSSASSSVSNSGSVGTIQSQIGSLQGQIQTLQSSAGAQTDPNILAQIQQLQRQVADLQAALNRLQQSQGQSSVTTYGQGLQYSQIVSAQGGQTAGVQTGGTYTVKKGDNLWNISKKYYGDGRQWRNILAANPNCLSRPGNVRTLRIGYVLNIPPLNNVSNVQTFSYAPQGQESAASSIVTYSLNNQNAASQSTGSQTAQQNQSSTASDVEVEVTNEVNPTTGQSSAQVKQSNGSLNVLGANTSNSGGQLSSNNTQNSTAPKSVPSVSDVADDN